MFCGFGVDVGFLLLEMQGPLVGLIIKPVLGGVLGLLRFFLVPVAFVVETFSGALGSLRVADILCNTYFVSDF